jgi:hypothetical protein
MVWEERFYAEPKDIFSIRLTCRKCQASSTIPLGDREYIPETCSYCHEGWFTKGSTDHKYLTWLLQSLIGLRRRDTDALCNIHFELPGHLNMPNGT